MAGSISVSLFSANISRGLDDLLLGVNPESLIGHRYLTLKSLHENGTKFNQPILAHILQSQLSAKATMLRFVNSVLILTGMLGTIVSLTLALLGASQLLDDVTQTDGLSRIIMGMSTALTTTLTAIVCYLLFRYFFGRLHYGQTQLTQNIERITSLHLAPRFELSEEKLVGHLTNLSAQLQGLTKQLADEQQKWLKCQQDIVDLLKGGGADHSTLESQLKKINETLSKGFRLEGN